VKPETASKDAHGPAPKLAGQVENGLLIAFDEIRASFGVATVIEVAQRPDAAADTIAWLEHDRLGSTLVDLARRYEAGQAGPDNRHPASRQVTRHPVSISELNGVPVLRSSFFEARRTKNPKTTVVC
jgi:hypothetical protein